MFNPERIQVECVGLSMFNGVLTMLLHVLRLGGATPSRK